MNRELQIYIVVIVLLLAFSGWFGWKQWYLGDKTSDYDIVCIGTHEYYKASLGQKGFLGIRLQDDGTPVKCIGD